MHMLKYIITCLHLFRYSSFVTRHMGIHRSRKSPNPSIIRLFRSADIRSINGREEMTDNSVKKTLDIPDSLFNHIFKLVENSVADRVARHPHLTFDPSALANQIINELLEDANSKDFSNLNRAIFEKGTLISKALRTLPIDELNSTLSFTPRLSRLLFAYNLYQQHNKAVFTTIVSHHHNVSKSAWGGVVNNTEALKSYSNAASAMGTKVWVKECNTWMANFAITFFRQGGAIKHFLKVNSLRKYEYSDYNSLAKDLMRVSDKSEDRFRKIRVLDVGSCYNPLQKLDQSTVLEITAVDLHPADDSVFYCDFLGLKIGPKGSKPIYEDIVDEDKGQRKKLIQLPAASFDAITMSLVLSYLPSPEQREIMVWKARQLLVSQSDFNEDDIKAPHYRGLLLIIEKSSIFDRFKRENELMVKGTTLISEWKSAMNEIGFDNVKYQYLLTNDSRHSHAFAFAARDITTSESDLIARRVDSYFNCDVSERNMINGGASMSRLYIRQDFEREFEENNGLTSESDILASTTSKWNSLPIGIIGGGLGGCAIALSLQQRGIPFKLFEKDQNFLSRRQGYALTIQQASYAMKELGLAEELKKLGVVSVGHYSFDHLGNILGAYGAMRNASKSPDCSAIKEPQHRHNIHIPRQVLRNMILTRIEQDKIHWNKRLVSVAFGESVKVTFQDGSDSEFSLLVGADGIFSTVRQLVGTNKSSSSSLSDLKYLNLMVILGIANIPSRGVDDVGLVQRQWLDGKTRIFTMPFDATRTMWQLSFPLSEEDALDMTSRQESLKRMAIDRCQGWDPTLLEILHRTDDQLVSGHPVYDRDVGNILIDSDRRVTFIGDAAHPMSPMKGQGANQALLDALSLSKAIVSSELAKPGRRSLTNSMLYYESEMRKRVSEKVIRSRQAAEFLHSDAALAIADITRAKAAEQMIVHDIN